MTQLKQDYQYDLPEHLIAQQPLENRSSSRLLCLHRSTGVINDTVFAHITDCLKPGDLLVLNNTRVIPARLFGNKLSGGKVEILIERILDKSLFVAQLRTSKPLKLNQEITIANQYRLLVTARDNNLLTLKLLDGCTVEQLLDSFGHIPLPPYIRRQDTAEDRSRYQTVFAKHAGAAAAPTAGLHFDDLMLNNIRKFGVEIGFITLHVGAGTFQPIRADKLSDHIMHSERVEVNAHIVDQIRQTHADGGRIVAVGTTVVRALETASLDGQIKPFNGETALFITPGFTFNCVNALLTNFHVSESTLLALVCAFGGYQQVMNAYRHAVAQSYRFFSYGDAMFIGDFQRRV